MSFNNPTRVRIGMEGNLGGKTYRVLGRSVLGESEGGGTYYWNEFNLETSTGEEATLVYEETEGGPQWRLFVLFEPEYPMSAPDAASKQVGDRLNLTGEDVRVTFRGRSRVYYIEGQGPEGEAVGEVAEYFNAEAGETMQVVSWTGDLVEYYNGVNLAHGVMAVAFGLPVPAETSRLNLFSSAGGDGGQKYTSMGKTLLQSGFVIVLFLIIFGRGLSFSPHYELSPVKKVPAGERPLEVGATGTLDNKLYRVSTHAVADMAEVGADWQRHEYQLVDEEGNGALLVCGGDQTGRTEWVLFEPFLPPEPFSAVQAASKCVGDGIQIGEYSGRVSGIFSETIERTEGADKAGMSEGLINYGFRCTSQGLPLLVRWNKAGIQFYLGRTMPASKGMAAFAPAK